MRAAALLVFLGGAVHASGAYERTVVYDLTKGADGGAKARDSVRWSHPRRLELHDDGFGFEGKENSCVDGWIHFWEPIAVGVQRWAPESVSVRVRIDRDRRENTPETVYARYSLDTARWSDWQILPAASGRALERWTHAGVLRVAAPDREAFLEACYEDARESREGPDAAATLKRLLEEDPRYLERGIPGIGYVQLLHESTYFGGQRFRRIEVTLGCVIPGPVRQSGEYWRFREEFRVDGEGRLRVPPGSNPRELSLRGTALTDDGLAALGALPGLRRLDLSDTKVTDAGLARVGDLRLLEWLDLSGTGITDAGLAHLRKLRCLEDLGLRGTAVTDEAAVGLRDALRPRLRVRRQAPEEARRIERLLVAVESVGLLRDGTDSGGTYSSGRLRRELDSFASRVKTAEDFIERIAAVDGEPYRVRLADGTVVDLATWLRGQLDR